MALFNSRWRFSKRTRICSGTSPKGAAEGDVSGAAGMADRLRQDALTAIRCLEEVQERRGSLLTEGDYPTVIATLSISRVLPTVAAIRSRAGPTEAFSERSGERSAT